MVTFRPKASSINGVLDRISEDTRTIFFITAAIENILTGYRGRKTYRIIGMKSASKNFAVAELGKNFASCSETHFWRKTAATFAKVMRARF